MHRSGLIWVLIGMPREGCFFPSCPVAEGQPAILNSCEDPAAGRVQMPLSATCPQGEALVAGVSVGRGEVGLLKRRSLGYPAALLKPRGCPAKSLSSSLPLPVSPWALGMEAQEALSSGRSSRDPLRKEAGMRGAWGTCMCVCCVHENWHMCTCVAVSGCGAESERM